MNHEEIYFRDRREAGARLADLLEKYRGQKGVIFALPRGGVPVGKIIADRLRWPLDLLIIRKIGHPYNPEYALGAVSDEGLVVVNPTELKTLDRKWFDQEKERQQLEAKRRRELYLKDRAPVDPKGITAIIVDDGIATGSTMLAAIRALKQKRPARIIAAVPVAPRETAAAMGREVDEFVAVSIPKFFLGAIGAYYEDFSQVSDEEVVALLKETD
jgi:putative phosphoribosyl transferase